MTPPRTDPTGSRTPLRIVFMGTPDFSVPALSALLDAGHDIVCVYSQPPRRAGRGQKERPSPVHAFAAERDIEVRTPKSLRDSAEQQAFAGLGADIAVVVAYGLILPQPILDAPTHGCLNIHASLLPRWRGAAPIQRALLAGDDETGVTIMQMEAGLDTGDMLRTRAIPITEETTASDLHDRLAALGADLILETLDSIVSGTVSATPQPAEDATYAAKLTREEGQLDWTKPADQLARMVRAFTPWPGAWFEHEGERIKVLAAQQTGGGGAPGTVLDGELTVACGAEALRLVRVQRSGKGPVDAEAFLRGYPLPAGTVLS